MLRKTVLACLTLLLLSVGIISTSAQQATSASAALQVVDSSPAVGAELALDQPITIYFDRPVDCNSAQAAFKIDPQVAGTITCSDSDASLTFKANANFAPDTSFTITLDGALKSKDGTSLAQPFSLQVSTVSSPKVAQVLPTDGSDGVDTDSEITVIFNRPMVPLTVAEDSSTLPQPLTFTPAVKGKGEWLNTSIYVFHPNPALQGGTTYTVTVSNLTSVDGVKLDQPFSWSFTTAAPSVSQVVPNDAATDVGLDTTVQVKFNQPMDQKSAEASFSLHPASDATAKVTGKFTWADDSAGFEFKPDQNLKIGTDYVAEFTSNLPLPEGGGAALTGQIKWTFSTVPLPGIVSTTPFDSQTDAAPDSGFTINFASPMNQDTLQDHVIIDPKPIRDFDSYYSTYDNSYTLSFPAEPSTSYTITITPGMADVYGHVITQQTVVHFTTKPYDPDVSLQVPGTVGFYNAASDKTQLFLTHRNVSQVNLSLYSVGLSDFISALTYSNNYGDPTQSLSPDSSSLLRQWTIPSSTPLNQTRYELLNLGNSASTNTAAACTGAPATRLQVGDTAIVISDPDPIRARASAPDGTVVGSLYKNYQLPIVGGPLCANSMLWWQVTLRDGTSAWVAEGTKDEYYLDLKTAVAQTAVPITQANGQALIPGIYFLQASSPETVANGINPAENVMVVANANLTLKYSVDSLLIWATDVNSGEPIPNAPIKVYDDTASVIASGMTDSDGLLKVSIPRADNLDQVRIAVLQTDKLFGFGDTNWSDGVNPWDFNQNPNYYPYPYRAYLYTERPVYRPGQPVYFRGVIRQENDVTYTAPDFTSIPVRIIDDQGQTIYQKTLPLTAYGTFSDSFNIAADASLGYYQIIAQLPGEDATNNYPQTGSVSFGVAQYRAPEFQVNVTAQTPEVVQGDTIKVVVDSKYFFGGNVANADVQWNVTAQPYSFNYTGSGSYSFEDIDTDAGPSDTLNSTNGVVTSGEGKTDANGDLTISFPADLQDATQSQTFTIEATVTDASQQAVSGRTDVIVHKGLDYVGVQPEEYVVNAGDKTNVDLLTVDWNSKPVANQTLDVTVVERRWSSVQEKDDQGRTTWTYQVQNVPVTTGTVTTDANGKAVYSFTPPNGGIFKISATMHDTKGNAILASNEIWVSSTQYVTWRQQNSNRIDLIADSQNYKVGDTASILIASPFQGNAEALITVERGEVLTTQHITMTSNSYVYKLPITDDFAPNVFVSVVIVKGVDANNPVAGFRMGLVQLNVDPSHKAINIAITTDKPQAGPGDTVNYTVKTTDYQGKPVQAEVGVSLTDLSVLTLADPNSPPILMYFYGQQGLGVKTSTPLTINTDQITQTVLNTIKGGGGGFGEGGIFDIRQQFVDTPYWNGSLTTDSDGTATFSVKLPDNLTTWRLDARAITNSPDGDMLVGQTTFDLLSTKTLLIRPVTPRFFVIGDTVTLGAVVNNNGKSDLAVDVALQGDGVTPADGTQLAQKVTVPAGGETRVNWTVTVNDVSAVDLTFLANGGNGLTDASKPPLGQGDARTLPVYKYEAPETVATGGVLRDAGSTTESIVLPRNLNVTQGTLGLELDPSLAASSLSSLDYLRNYPYQSTEATVSTFLPNIMTYRALESAKLDNATLKDQLDSAVNDALQKLYAQQHVDGGWGWSVQDDSDATVTAYALIGLSEAKAQGFNVDDTVLNNARAFLRTTFITPSLKVATWQLNRQAFILYALARSGSPDVARTTTLYDLRSSLNLYAEGFLALTFHYIDPKDTSRSDVLLSDLNNAAAQSATGVHWNEKDQDYYNWNTDTRTTAIALDAFVLLKPDSDLIPNIVRYLMVMRKADSWETTQETAWAVMSLTDTMSASGELNPNYSYTATLNDQQLSQGAVTPDKATTPIMLQAQVAQALNNLVISRTGGSGALYYTARLNVNLPVPQIQAINRGIIVQREYTLPGSDTPITSAKVGDNVQVRLTIIAPNDLHYVTIEDPIPAGTDAVNPDLSTSQQVGTQPELNPADPLSQGWGWWYFSNIEFRDQKVVFYSTYLPAGTYEYVYTIRAGLAGTFNVIPATGSETYFPEVYGRSEGSTFTITDAGS